jgi:hypothetical protein
MHLYALFRCLCPTVFSMMLCMITLALVMWRKKERHIEMHCAESADGNNPKL